MASNLTQDTFDPKQLLAMYENTSHILDVDPTLQDLAKRMVKEGWTQDKFNSELMKTTWYQTHQASMRNYLLQAANPDNADFIATTKDVTNFVQQRANKMGVTLSAEKLKERVTQTMMYGWNDPSRQYELDKVLSQEKTEGPAFGTIEDNAQKLRNYSQNNGVYMSNDWYNSAARSVDGQLTDYSFWEAKLREQAVNKFPTFADQINAGQSMNAIADPYIQTMASELDLNPNSITLNDSTILGALTGYTDKGQPNVKNLGQFRADLRKDPRWMNTDRAQNQISGTAEAVMQMFGLVG